VVVIDWEMKHDVTPSAANKGNRRLTIPLAHHTTSFADASKVANANTESVARMLLPGACITQVIERSDGTLMREQVTALKLHAASSRMSLLNKMQPATSALMITSSSSMSLQRILEPGGCSHDAKSAG
jgi:hypothetical protein